MGSCSLFRADLFQNGGKQPVLTKLTSFENVSIPHMLTICMLGNFACVFIICESILKLTFSNNLSVIPSECQTFWIQIGPDVLLGLIWVQTVSKGYQQTTKFATSKEIVNPCHGEPRYTLLLQIV